MCPRGVRSERLVSAHPSLSVLDTRKLRTKSTLGIQGLLPTRVTGCAPGRVRLPSPGVRREEAVSGVAGGFTSCLEAAPHPAPWWVMP